MTHRLLMSRKFCNISTGYFASEKHPQRRGKVHIVGTDGLPVCGAKPKSIYYQCANGAYYSYLECARCKVLYHEIPF